MPSDREPDAAKKAGRRRVARMLARLRTVAAEAAVPGFVEGPMPGGSNPSARRVRRLARKGLLTGWPWRQS